MNEAISLARQCKGSITGIYVLPSLPSEPTISVSYRQYLSRAIASEVNVNLSEVSPSAEKSVETVYMLWLLTTLPKKTDTSFTMYLWQIPMAKCIRL